MKLPIYFNCYFQNKKSESTANIYRIEASLVDLHPYQLFKWMRTEPCHWENMSVYASVNDTVMVILKELFSKELSAEIDHGQATINPAEILQKIEQGEKSISIYDVTNKRALLLEVGVAFEDLVQRN